MVYGRPVGIPHMGNPVDDIALPSLVDDRYIAAGESQPIDIPSTNAFFVSVVKLYRVMDEILESLRNISPMSKMSSNTPTSEKVSGCLESCSCCVLSQLTAILRLDTLLLKWHNELPQHLKFSLDGVEEPTLLSVVFQRQKVILKTRFLGMRILLNRQSILFLLQAPGERKWPRNTSRKWPPLFSDIGGPASGTSQNACTFKCGHSTFVEAQLARISANICVQMAQLQIEEIDSSRQTARSGAWWWDFHCEWHKIVILEYAHVLTCDQSSSIHSVFFSAPSGSRNQTASQLSRMSVKIGPTSSKVFATSVK